MMSSPSSTTNGLSPTCLRATEHGVAEPERLALAHVVDVGQVGQRLDLAQLLELALGLELVLELEGAVEVVLEGCACRGR